MLQSHTLIAEAAVGQGACQKPEELAEFLDILADLKPDVMVEIGVFAGGTLYAWSHFASTVIGIDETPGGLEPIYLSHGRPRQEHGSIAITGNSHDSATVDKLIEVLDGRMIDCLFIDGDHTYEGVRQDYEMYSPLVRPGGLIAFHDIVTHNYAVNCDVVTLWCEIKNESAIEIISSEGNHWGGIGALYVQPLCD